MGCKVSPNYKYVVKENIFFQLGFFFCLFREKNDSSDLVSLRTAVAKGIYTTCGVEFILLFQDAFVPLPQNVFPLPPPPPGNSNVAFTFL